MQRALLDSSFIIGYSRGKARCGSVFEELKLKETVFCTCDMVLAEYFAGLDKLQAGTALAFINRLAYLKSNPAVAFRGAQYFRELDAGGRRVGLADCLIAALAEWHDAKVVTLDGHFRRFRGLDVVYVR